GNGGDAGATGGGGGGGDESDGGAGGYGGGGGGAGENDSNSAKVGGAGGFGGGGGGGGEDQNGGAGGFGGGGGGGNNDGTGPAISGAGGFGGGNGGDDGNGAVANSAGGGGGAGLGGAIFNFGGTLTLENCTLSANAAAGGTGGTSGTVNPGTDGSGLGGALFNLNGTVSLQSTTLASNTAGVGADLYNLGHLEQGGVPGGSATVDVEGSILNSVGNGNAVATQALGVADSDAALTFVGTNLTQLALQNVGGLVSGAITVTDAQLGPLTDNGGPTATHALTYPGSPAIDAAADGPATDQRGAARPEGASFDVGSVEVPQSCGDGVVTQDEACDDGNTVEGDGCSAACEETCAPAPELMCAPASTVSLTIDERKPGKEKLKASLKKFAGGVATADFGDPVAGDTAVRICVYDGADALALDLLVDRAGDLCGAKPCWKALKTTGFAYKDALAAADGVDKIGAKSGAAGKGSLTVSAKNNGKKGQTALPTGAAALLEGDTSATVQVLTSDAGCFEGSLTAVKSADGTQFKAK
ncbi:MAG TPA: choice-of-anchor Q domain-containing protein, partial [Myxococcota bacterium]|nr:choice-of-anchor Q domain-containing protein [Myxococcota bacterium]